MSILFLISVFGLLTTVPLHFIAMDRKKLEQRFGKEKGEVISKIFGILSSIPFLFWFGIMLAPQPKFTFFFYPLHLIIALPLLIISCLLAILGILAVGLKQAITHPRPKRIVKTGVYSLVRHPQHFASLLAHIGASFLFSSWQALLFSPVLVFIVYLDSKIEENDLVGEFGKVYREYQKKVPMLIPRLRR